MSETSKPASCVKENLPDYVSDSSLPTYLFLHTTLSQDVGSLAVGNPRKTISEPLVILAVSIREAGTPTVREVSAVQAQVSLCTQYAYHAEAGYEILNNLWGKDTATSGSQCTYFDGTAGSGIKWSTQWIWAGGQDNVKSYALGRYGGVWPISQSGAPIANVTIAGYKFDLYFGYNGLMRVFSFLAPTPNSPYPTFKADIKLIFNYLTQNQGYPVSTQNLIVYQIGTESFTGGLATFTVDNFVANVNM